jgi:hypothetical protein
MNLNFFARLNSDQLKWLFDTELKTPKLFLLTYNNHFCKKRWEVSLTFQDDDEFRKKFPNGDSDIVNFCKGLSKYTIAYKVYWEGELNG